MIALAFNFTCPFSSNLKFQIKIKYNVIECIKNSRDVKATCFACFWKIIMTKTSCLYEQVDAVN